MNTLRDTPVKSKEVVPSEKLKSGKYNRRFYIFSACLLISIFSWFLIKIEKNYNHHILLKVNYTGFPNDKIPANKLPEKISIEVKASGFKLISLSDAPVNLNCSNMKRFKSDVFILSASKIKSGIASQLGDEVEIINVNPDTVFFNFGKRITKRVPVKLNFKYSIDKEYCLGDSIKIQPEFITVSGAEDLLEKITFISTEETALQNMDTPFKEKIRLKTPGKGEADLSVDSVTVFIPIEKLVELEIEVPVTVKNLSENFKISLDEEKITVKFFAPESKVKYVKPISFIAAIDYKNMKRKGKGTAKVLLVKYPSFARNCTLSEPEINYSITKK